MKVGVKLANDVVIVAHQIVQVVSMGSEMHIDMASKFRFVLVLEGNTTYLGAKVDHDVVSILAVSINEMHRIVRELSEYLGVDVQTINA